MLRFFTICNVLAGAIFQIVFAQSSDSLAKKEAYLEYIKAKEVEISQNKSERDQLRTSLVALDSSYLAAVQSRDEVSHKEKVARLQVNTTKAALAAKEDGLTYNKTQTKKFQDMQLETKRELDLKKLAFSEVNHDFIEVEANVNRGEENAVSLTKEIKELEDKVHDLEITYRKYQNEVDVRNSEIISITVSLDDASNKVETLKGEMKSSESRMAQLDGNALLQTQEIEDIQLKMTKNKEKIEESKESEIRWEKQISDVTRKIDDLQSFKKGKKEVLANTPDSLKTSTMIAGAQQEIRMADTKLKSLNEEKFGLEKDLAQLQQDSKVIASENQNLANEVQVLQSKLKSTENEKLEAARLYKDERDRLQRLEVRVHDLATQKEQKQAALQKAEGQLDFYKSEYEAKATTLAEKEQDIDANREGLIKNQSIKDSLAKVKENLDQEVSRLDGKDKIERHKINVLRDEKNELNRSLDSLRREAIEVERESDQAVEALKRAEDEVQGLADSKVLLSDRLKELEHPTEDQILLGIEEAKKGNFEGFLSTLGAALEKDKSGEAYTLQGYTQYVKGDVDAAEQSYTDAIRTSPRFIDPYELRANLREENENYNGALKDVNQIVYLDSTRAQAFYKRGVLLHYFLNESEAACKAWQTALSLGVKEANEQIARHCLHSVSGRFYNVTQLTKRAVNESYGFDKFNPIKVGKNESKTDQNIIQFLDLLRDSKNEPVRYARLGSCCRYESENGLRDDALLERYRIQFRNEAGKKDEQILYFTYYDYEKPLLPVGLNTNHDIY